HTNVRKVEAAETGFDFSVLDAAVEQATSTDCCDLELELELEGSQVETVEQTLAGQVVLDIRHPDEEELKPLELEGVEVLKVPFYQLNSRFAELVPARAYLLYCEKGVMSRLHAQYLLDRGHDNVR